MLITGCWKARSRTQRLPHRMSGKLQPSPLHFVPKTLSTGLPAPPPNPPLLRGIRWPRIAAFAAVSTLSYLIVPWDEINKTVLSYIPSAPAASPAAPAHAEVPAAAAAAPAPSEAAKQ